MQVNVKMTQDDFEFLRKAAEKKWPDAVMTNSGIVLALAKIAARWAMEKRARQTSSGTSGTTRTLAWPSAAP